jgi:hypothetical protein
MKKNIFIITVLTLTLFSCHKEEGEGGRSSVIGKVHATDITGGTQGVYDIPDYDVYIIYGEENDIYDDDMKTNYDGTFEFKNLRKGFYRVYAYTRNFTASSTESAWEPVFQSIEIGKNERGDVGIIEIEK